MSQSPTGREGSRSVLSDEQRHERYSFAHDGPSKDNWIYHYTSTETAALILTSGMIRLGAFSRTNDPREQREWFPSVTEGTSDEIGKDEFWNICREIDAAMRGRTKLACFTRDRNAGETHGHLNFHRGWARARMWDQYAEHHRGACFVFARDRWQAAVGRVVDALVKEGLDAKAEIGPFTLHGDVSYVDRPVELERWSHPDEKRIVWCGIVGYFRLSPQ